MANDKCKVSVLVEEIKRRFIPGNGTSAIFAVMQRLIEPVALWGMARKDRLRPNSLLFACYLHGHNSIPGENRSLLCPWCHVR